MELRDVVVEVDLEVYYVEFLLAVAVAVALAEQV